MGDIQHIPQGGFLISESYYKRLKAAERDLHYIDTTVIYLEEQRARQNEELDYYLSPDGGYAQKLREQEEREAEWLARMQEHPTIGPRLRKR